MAEVAQKYCTNEFKKPQVVSNIADGLKILSNYPNIRDQVLNEVVAMNTNSMPYHKRVDKR